MIIQPVALLLLARVQNRQEREQNWPATQTTLATASLAYGRPLAWRGPVQAVALGVRHDARYPQIRPSPPTKGFHSNLCDRPSL